MVLDASPRDGEHKVSQEGCHCSPGPSGRASVSGLYPALADEGNGEPGGPATGGRAVGSSGHAEAPTEHPPLFKCQVPKATYLFCASPRTERGYRGSEAGAQARKALL